MGMFFLTAGAEVSQCGRGFHSGIGGFTVGLGVSQWEWGFHSGNGGFTVGVGVSQWEQGIHSLPDMQDRGLSRPVP